MARSVSLHQTPTHCSLQSVLSLGALVLLALAVVSAGADLFLTPYHPDTILRPQALTSPACRSPTSLDRGAVQAPPTGAAPAVRVRRAAPSPRAMAPSDRGGLLGALRELAAEGRLPEPSMVDPAALGGSGPLAALADAGKLALSAEPDGINVRRGSALAGTQQLDELVTSGTQEVSYGPKPAPEIDLDDGSEAAPRVAGHEAPVRTSLPTSA